VMPVISAFFIHRGSRHWETHATFFLRCSGASLRIQLQRGNREN
jgi:hypothetical protein